MTDMPKALLKAVGALRTIRNLNVPGDVLDLAGEHKRVADEALREIGPPHKIGASITIFEGKR
jgi:hypothetical protein